jgi:DNA polymerase kappa
VFDQISGIGRVREHMLNALKVTTCGELYQQRGLLHLLFSHTSSTHFLRVSVGLGSTHVHRFVQWLSSLLVAVV